LIAYFDHHHLTAN